MPQEVRIMIGAYVHIAKDIHFVRMRHVRVVKIHH